MKKIISIGIVIALAATVLLGLASCNQPEEPDNTVIRIGYMAGPTGMGMAKLIHDNGGVEGNEKYTFEKFADTEAAKKALFAGTVDMICYPTNNAAIDYNNTEQKTKVIAINCLNSVYLMVKKNLDINSVSDLEGKTVYTLANGTPSIILKHLLEESEINATVSTALNDTVIKTPANIKDLVVNGSVDIALVPEPMVTMAKKDTQDYKTIDVTSAWNEISSSPITMGCLVANADFVEAHKSVVNSFLTEYKSSIEYISNSENLETAADYVVETGVMGAKPLAKMAISNLGANIGYLDGADMKEALQSFYNTIGASMIGGKLPDDEFYYSK